MKLTLEFRLSSGARNEFTECRNVREVTKHGHALRWQCFSHLMYVKTKFLGSGSTFHIHPLHHGAAIRTNLKCLFYWYMVIISQGIVECVDTLNNDPD